MDLDHLKRFYEVVRKGSLSAAAESLHISQSALSRTMQILEDQLGVKLLERHATGVSATQEGEKLFEFANRVVQEAKIVERLIRDSPQEAQGKLTVMTTPYLASNWLMKYIPSFLEEYPQLRIKLIGQHYGLDINRTDVLISPYILEDPGITQRRLMDMPMKLYASHAYLHKRGIPHMPEDLNRHQIISFGDITDTPHKYINWHLTLGCKAGQFRYPYIEVNSIEGLTNAAIEGLGIATLPLCVANNFTTKLVEILPDIEVPVVPIYYAYFEKFKNSKRITALADYLERCLSKTAE